jgi:hypothetical protein
LILMEEAITVPPYQPELPYPGPDGKCPHSGGAYAPAFRCAWCSLLDDNPQLRWTGPRVTQ